MEIIDKKILTTKAIKLIEEEIKAIQSTIKSTEQQMKDAPGANKSHSDTVRSQKEGLLIGFIKQLTEKQRSLTQLKGVSDVATNRIITGSLVMVQSKGNNKYYLYFIVPGGGAKKITISGKTVILISPNSPVATGLLGHRVGDDVGCRIPDGIIQLKVIKIL